MDELPQQAKGVRVSSPNPRSKSEGTAAPGASGNVGISDKRPSELEIALHATIFSHSVLQSLSLSVALLSAFCYIRTVN